MRERGAVAGVQRQVARAAEVQGAVHDVERPRRRPTSAVSAQVVVVVEAGEVLRVRSPGANAAGAQVGAHQAIAVEGVEAEVVDVDARRHQQQRREAARAGERPAGRSDGGVGGGAAGHGPAAPPSPAIAVSSTHATADQHAGDEDERRDGGQSLPSPSGWCSSRRSPPVASDLAGEQARQHRADPAAAARQRRRRVERRQPARPAADRRPRTPRSPSSRRRRCRARRPGGSTIRARPRWTGGPMMPISTTIVRK